MFFLVCSTVFLLRVLIGEVCWGWDGQRDMGRDTSTTSGSGLYPSLFTPWFMFVSLFSGVSTDGVCVYATLKDNKYHGVLHTMFYNVLICLSSIRQSQGVIDVRPSQKSKQNKSRVIHNQNQQHTGTDIISIYWHNTNKSSNIILWGRNCTNLSLHDTCFLFFSGMALWLAMLV